MAPVPAPAPAPVYFTLALDQAKEDLAKRGVPIYDFGVGDPNEPTPAFIRQALIDALDPVSNYPTVVGQRRLREAYFVAIVTPATKQLRKMLADS